MMDFWDDILKSSFKYIYIYTYILYMHIFSHNHGSIEKMGCFQNEFPFEGKITQNDHS